MKFFVQNLVFCCQLLDAAVSLVKFRPQIFVAICHLLAVALEGPQHLFGLSAWHGVEEINLWPAVRLVALVCGFEVDTHLGVRHACPDGVFPGRLCVLRLRALYQENQEESDKSLLEVMCEKHFG